MVIRTSERNPELITDPTAVAASGQPALQVEGLCAAYGSQVVLEDVCLQIEPGQVLALIGPNGAGKSNLIRALTGVLPLQSGRVRVAGQDLAELSVPARARLLAVVPQARNLPPAFTARETVLLGRTPHLNWLGQTGPQDEEIVRQAMLRTHTLHLASRSVGELSGGEQQRLLLARALAQSAPVLLLDEPTAHLDLKYQVTLLDQVRELARSERLTVLVALHDLNLVLRYADRAALLVAGSLQAFGEPEEVLTAERLSDAYQIPLQVVRTQPGGKTLIVPGNV